MWPSEFFRPEVPPSIDQWSEMYIYQSKIYILILNLIYIECHLKCNRYRHHWITHHCNYDSVILYHQERPHLHCSVPAEYYIALNIIIIHFIVSLFTYLSKAARHLCIVMASQLIRIINNDLVSIALFLLVEVVACFSVLHSITVPETKNGETAI